MLYWLAEWLGFPGVLNLIRYLSFRSGAAVATALIIGLWIGPRFILMLRMRQGKGQPIREDGPQSHLAKKGTPTMGGLMILISLMISALLWMDLSNRFVWACIFVTGGFALVGFLDDLDKVTKSSHRGIPGRVRLLVEFVIAGIAVLLIVSRTGTDLYLPFFSEVYIPLGPLYYVFAMVLIVGFGNAVNLTDGLDGLATGASVAVTGGYVLIGTWQSNQSCLLRPGPQCYEVRDPRDLAVVAACVMGACFGFLWWNASPAKIFMGDTGSLALGGAIAGLAITTRTELLLVLLGGLFVLIEASVIIQVASFKMTGKRVFRMAPLQHHFELVGWGEVTIVIRFWIIAGLCLGLGLGVFYAEWVVGT